MRLLINYYDVAIGGVSGADFAVTFPPSGKPEITTSVIGNRYNKVPNARVYTAHYDITENGPCSYELAGSCFQIPDSTKPFGPVTGALTDEEIKKQFDLKGLSTLTTASMVINVTRVNIGGSLNSNFKIHCPDLKHSIPESLIETTRKQIGKDETNTKNERNADSDRNVDSDQKVPGQLPPAMFHGVHRMVERPLNKIVVFNKIFIDQGAGSNCSLDVQTAGAGDVPDDCIIVRNKVFKRLSNSPGPSIAQMREEWQMEQKLERETPILASLPPFAATALAPIEANYRTYMHAHQLDFALDGADGWAPGGERGGRGGRGGAGVNGAPGAVGGDGVGGGDAGDAGTTSDDGDSNNSAMGGSGGAGGSGGRKGNASGRGQNGQRGSAGKDGQSGG
jgi:hypothetical protein